jgi:predicted dienelactone hydrolase
MEAVLDAALSHSEFDGVRVDAGRVGVAGHSLGGYTVLGLAGGWPSWKDPRIRAVLAPSPYSSPYLSKEQRANLNIPVMYQGGTGDSVVTPTVKKSGGAYDQSAKPKYYIEFDGAGRFAWTNRNRTYVASINKYSVPFYDAYLKGRKDDLTKLLNAGRPKDVSDLRFAE